MEIEVDYAAFQSNYFPARDCWGNWLFSKAYNGSESQIDLSTLANATFPLYYQYNIVNLVNTSNINFNCTSCPSMDCICGTCNCRNGVANGDGSCASCLSGFYGSMCSPCPYCASGAHCNDSLVGTGLCSMPTSNPNNTNAILIPFVVIGGISFICFVVYMYTKFKRNRLSKAALAQNSEQNPDSSKENLVAITLQSDLKI